MAEPMHPILRFGVLTTNIVILICGIMFIVQGAFWIEIELEYEKARQKPYIYIGAVLMTIGLIQTISTVFAFYGSIRRNHYLLHIICFLSFILCLLCLDYAIIALFLQKSTSNLMTDFRKDLSEVFEEPKENWNQFYDYLHQKLHCCGLNSSEDFQKIHNQVHPGSCCGDNLNCTSPAYTRGCLESFEDYMRNKFVLSASVSFVVAILNFLTAVCGYIVKRPKDIFSE